MTKPETVDTKIAVINTNIGFIQKDINGIKQRFDDFTSIFATKEQLVQTAKETETRLTSLEKTTSLSKWLSPTISAILSSLLTFLIIQYLMHVK